MFRSKILFRKNITKENINILLFLSIYNEAIIKMAGVKKIKNLTNEWIDDEEDIAEDKRDFLGNDGVNIFSKKSGEKTVEERIKTSRTLKIKNNKWNQVDYTEDFSNDKITIDPHSYQYNSSYEYVYFEQELQKITNQISNEIEHILIEVYNYHISSANSQIKSLNLVGFQEQVSVHFIHNRY